MYVRIICTYLRTYLPTYKGKPSKKPGLELGFDVELQDSRCNQPSGVHLLIHVYIHNKHLVSPALLRSRMYLLYRATVRNVQVLRPSRGMRCPKEEVMMDLHDIFGGVLASPINP